MVNNYYEILGISNTASFEEIKRAYYTLSKKYHPDINPKTANLFRNITEAYNTLKDPSKRKSYDNKLVDNSNPFEDIDTTSFTDTYYTNPEYYQDPAREPIVNILEDFWKYRFENATAAIWNRNVFVLITNALLCFIIFCGILCNRVKKLFTKSEFNIKSTKNVWFTYIQEAIHENRLGKYTLWTIFMHGLAICKVIYHIFNILYWIFARILKYFLIPAAIILATLLHKYTPQRKI